MPPASGIALGFDRLAMLASGAQRIDQVIWTGDECAVVIASEAKQSRACWPRLLRRADALLAMTRCYATLPVFTMNASPRSRNDDTSRNMRSG